MIWDVMVKAAMEYGTEVWEPTNAHTRSALESLQTQSGVLVHGLNRKTNRECLRAVMGVNKLKYERAKRKLKFIVRLLRMDKSRLPRRIWDEIEPQQRRNPK